MDTSARTTMKGAAKCEKRCELQNSVSQLKVECMMRSRDIPGSRPASVFVFHFGEEKGELTPRLLSVQASFGGLRRFETRRVV